MRNLGWRGLEPIAETACAWLLLSKFGKYPTEKTTCLSIPSGAGFLRFTNMRSWIIGLLERRRSSSANLNLPRSSTSSVWGFSICEVIITHYMQRHFLPIVQPDQRHFWKKLVYSSLSIADFSYIIIWYNMGVSKNNGTPKSSICS